MQDHVPLFQWWRIPGLAVQACCQGSDALEVDETRHVDTKEGGRWISMIMFVMERDSHYHHVNATTR